MIRLDGWNQFISFTAGRFALVSQHLHPSDCTHCGWGLGGGGWLGGGGINHHLQEMELLIFSTFAQMSTSHTWGVIRRRWDNLKEKVQIFNFFLIYLSVVISLHKMFENIWVHWSHSHCIYVSNVFARELSLLVSFPLRAPTKRSICLFLELLAFFSWKIIPQSVPLRLVCWLRPLVPPSSN